MSLSLYDLFMTMGPFAKFIVIVLAVMSVFSWTSAFQKLVVPVAVPEGDDPSSLPSSLASSGGAARRVRDQAGRRSKNAVTWPGWWRGARRSEAAAAGPRRPSTAADINSVERAVEREMLIVAAELKRGLGILATTGATDAPFVGLLRHRDGDRERVHRHGGLGRRRVAGLGVGRYRGSAHHDRVRAHRRDSGGLALQLLHDQDRLLVRGDDVHLERVDRSTSSRVSAPSSAAGRSSRRNSRRRRRHSPVALSVH